ncbi:hypothetical protein JOD57_003729 [Geodermatophilus bullaregiensis]|uniref:hypothetical protein n=1 Tax=Geodermatophilus bullaregiensis TaxID=1564160 RepID=UPI0019577E2E|nr:hypothetical protein [Geodermatophilus bullaregiensis]MBM7807892.1 hypothetical protein [Geodermatophilus bullaregiensis]
MTASPAIRPTTARRSSPDASTTAGAAVGLGCTLVGTYVETPSRAGPGEWGVDFTGNGGWTSLAVLIAFVAVALVLVGLATARARAVPPEHTARRALVLAVLGAATVLVFWTGVPAVLAGGAAGLAFDVHRRLGRLPATALVALVVAVLTAAAAVWLAFAS